MKLKNVRRLLASLSLALLIVGTSTAAALSAPPIKLAAGFSKGNSTFDLIAQDAPGTKLVLYVNDKAASSATVNKQAWATFRGVKLADSGKLSFTKAAKNSHNQTYQRVINYARYFTVTGNTLSLQASPPVATPVTAVESTPVVTPTVAQTTPTPAPAPANTGTSDTNLSNNNTYTNSDGDTVHSPAASTDGSIPAGATARCNDGTYSFSQHRSGTCSGHKGVSSWL